MTADLMRFRYGSSDIRTVELDGTKWAVAADICGALELSDVRRAVERLDEADRRSTPIRSGGQNRQMWVVSEDGATDLVLDSRKPEARRFRKWLTHEVWPSIRDTGQYAVPDLDLSDPIAAIEAANARSQQAIEIAKSERAARLAAEVETKVLEAAIERDAPLVAKAEAHSGSDSAIHRQEFSREVIAWGRKQDVEIRQEEVMRFLGHIGLFIRGERTDTGHATSDAIKRGLAFTHKDTARNGYAYAVGKLTAAGQDYAWRRITSYVADRGSLELPRELRVGDSA